MARYDPSIPPYDPKRLLSLKIGGGDQQRLYPDPASIANEALRQNIANQEYELHHSIQQEDIRLQRDSKQFASTSSLQNFLENQRWEQPQSFPQITPTIKDDRELYVPGPETREYKEEHTKKCNRFNRCNQSCCDFQEDNPRGYSPQPLPHQPGNRNAFLGWESFIMEHGSRLSQENLIDLFDFTLEQARKLDHTASTRYRPSWLKDWSSLSRQQGMIHFPRRSMELEVFKLVYPRLDPDLGLDGKVTIMNRPALDEGRVMIGKPTMVNRTYEHNEYTSRVVAQPSEGPIEYSKEDHEDNRNQKFIRRNSNSCINQIFITDRQARRITNELVIKMATVQTFPEIETESSSPPVFLFEDDLEEPPRAPKGPLPPYPSSQNNLSETQ
jgi:hypothetical protein